MVSVKNPQIYSQNKGYEVRPGILVNLFPYFPLCVPFKASFSQPSCHLRRLRRRKIRWQLRLLTCRVYLKIVMINIDSFDDESNKWLLIMKLILWVCLIYIYICMYVCILYICMYMCVYIYTYMYTYVYIYVPPNRWLILIHQFFVAQMTTCGFIHHFQTHPYTGGTCYNVGPPQLCLLVYNPI